MPEYTVHKVEKVKEIPAPSGDGNLVVWKLGLEDSDGEKFWAETLKKPGNEPTTGKVSGTVESNDYGKRFKAQRTGGFGGGGGGRGPRDPAERASIENQVAAKVAADVVCALIAFGHITTAADAAAEIGGLTAAASKAIRA